MAEIEQLLIRAKLRRELPSPPVRRWLREKAGLTQAEVAKALGVTRPAVTRWESGRRTPRSQDAEAYAAFLKRLAEEQ